MTRLASTIILLAAASLGSCGGAPGDSDYSGASQRAIDADIAAAQSTGPTTTQIGAAPRDVTPNVELRFR